MKFIQRPIDKRIALFWGLFSGMLLLVLLFFFLLSVGALGFMPSFEELENPKSNLATEIISADQQVLGTFYEENRSYSDYEELSPHLINALVATEDARFHSHSGVDARGLGRVFFRTILMGDKNAGGGSTITQQLAKLLFHDRASNIWERGSQKLKEWIIAIKLERSYTKEEILTMYLNKVPFIYDAFGIKSATKTFFNTTPDSIKIEHAAVLIGMLKNPALYNPVRRPELTVQRRNVVMGQMMKAGHLTRAEFDSLCALPLGLAFKRMDHIEGLAPYFREHIRLIMSASEPKRERYPSYLIHKYEEDSVEWVNNPLYGWINKNLKSDGTKYDIYRDGLKIYTTIDSRMQQYAERAMTQHLGGELQDAFYEDKKTARRPPFTFRLTPEQYDNIIHHAMRNTERYRHLKESGANKDSINKVFNTPVPMKVFSWKGDKDTVMTPRDSILYYKFFLRASMLSIDPLSGHIKAYVGGPNYKHFKYDMVSLGKRQVGSTIKPFVYTLAMQEGHSPCDLVPNVPQTFTLPEGGSWTPKNSSDAREGEMVSLKWGLANSNNNITAWVMKQYNPQAVANMIHTLGVKSHMDAVYALCLGTPELSLMEMTASYCTFANKGVYTEPIMVTRIVDKFGTVVADFHPRRREAISETSAFLMLNLLQGVINQGTGMRLRGAKYGLRGEIGGKTGTTQNHSDGWFIGVTPNLVTGVWVGGEDRDIHFDRLNLGQGANMALPIWGLYMKGVYGNKAIKITEDDTFERPADFNIDLTCSDSHQVSANEGEIDEAPATEEGDIFF
ncbi:penicillin-binding protein 1A [Breznakibacter xylanolyticus]|uniref:Penicillin-binding protein 1A n=1 Tax=Breznakibacter xylanolyticus TaxID=990 RepID=A0A2W7NGW0_9BACT|nr:transglycosylase domain-containing protein [Breznakibacter xylanolyticus]PZX15924.1 penicillin-binding protein 1A [Breznakibacter xylanolyticus]